VIEVTVTGMTVTTTEELSGVVPLGPVAVSTYVVVVVGETVYVWFMPDGTEVPLMAHPFAPLTFVQLYVNVADWPATIVGGCEVNAAVGCKTGTVIVIDTGAEDLVVSCTDVATTSTVSVPEVICVGVISPVADAVPFVTAYVTC
jgi:hypothetical protein